MTLNRQAQRHIGLQFEKRQTVKTYKAVVAGNPIEESGTIELPLRTDWYCRPKQMVDTCLGRPALTLWKILDRRENNSLVELKPVTGRTHQLRVHMAAIGHPIVGDEFYAPAEFINESRRLMLHAESLEIRHPSGGDRLRLYDPCPF